MPRYTYDNGVTRPMTEDEEFQADLDELKYQEELENPSIVQKLNAAFESLPAEAQADLAPFKAAVKLELEQGRIAIAKLIIERATIPEALEALRAQMLELFNE